LVLARFVLLPVFRIGIGFLTIGVRGWSLRFLVEMAQEFFTACLTGFLVLLGLFVGIGALF
jgi:hypothetical protein